MEISIVTKEDLKQLKKNCWKRLNTCWKIALQYKNNGFAALR
jgi:hypothetical protein